MNISTRNCPFLTVDQVEDLKMKGIVTHMDFIRKDKVNVVTAGSLTDSVYDATICNLLDLCAPIPITASQLMDQSREPLFATGIAKLDDLLAGGLGDGEILEIYGEYRTGKTQICMSIAAQFCHFREDKLSVVYFDLKHDFRASRFLNFCEGDKNDLCNILIIRPTNIIELISDLEELKSDISKRLGNYFANLKLMIFDSVPMAIYPAVDDDPMSWRFYEEQFIQKVNELSKFNNGIMTVLVNHAVKPRSNIGFTSNLRISESSSSSGIFNNQAPLKPAMGKYWSHKPNFRIQVSENPRSNGNVFTAVLEKSSRTESMKKFEFLIHNAGIKSY